MQLSDHHLDEFIGLYQKHYGVVLERAVALEKGLQLCRFVEIVTLGANGDTSDKGPKDVV